MSRRAYLTPDSETGDDVCRQLSIPPELLPFVNEALDELANPANWEEHGDMSVDDTVALVNSMLFDSYGDCEVQNPITRLLTRVDHTANTTETFFDSYPSNQITVPADFGKDGDAVSIRSQWHFVRGVGAAGTQWTIRTYWDSQATSVVVLPSLSSNTEHTLEFDTYIKFLESTGYPIVQTRAIIRTYATASLPTVAIPTTTLFPMYLATPFSNPDWTIEHVLTQSLDATVTVAGQQAFRDWGITEHWRF